MHILDCVNMTLIGGAAVFCVIKGFKKNIFKTLAFVYAVVFAGFVTTKCNGLVLSNIDIISLENKLIGAVWTEKINSAFTTALGTIIMTVTLHIMLKQIFRVVDGRFDSDIYTEITDRLRGAVDGLFVFYSLCMISLVPQAAMLAQNNSIKVTQIRFMLPEQINIHRQVRNLN